MPNKQRNEWSDGMWRPTIELRHIEREVFFTENGDNLVKVIVVLQQRMEDTATGELMWQDVPLVELDET